MTSRVAAGNPGPSVGSASSLIRVRNRLYGRPVAGPDRMWGGASVGISVGPLALPSRTELVGAVRRLAEFAEMTRVGWLPARGGRCWTSTTDLAAFAEASVQELVVVPGEDPADTVIRVLQLSRDGLPFRLFAAPEVLHMNVAHAWGDGYSMTRLLAAVIETARTGSMPQWVSRQPVQFGATGAVLSFFARHPRELRQLAMSSRQPVRVAGAPPGPAVPWSPSVACRFRVSSQESFRALKVWRRQHGSGVSTIPLAICVTELALRQLGIKTSPEPLVVFDARRYLRDRGADMAGNFCAGLRMHVPDSGDVFALDQEIKSAVALGRPLAVLAAGSISSYLRPAAVGSSRRTGTAWDMAYSHMGRPVEITRLPFLKGGREPFYMGVLTPAGPDGVTVGFTEIGNRVNAFASFHDNVIDPAAVEAMLDLVCGDPVALLEQHRLEHRAETEHRAAKGVVWQ